MKAFRKKFFYLPALACLALICALFLAAVPAAQAGWVLPVQFTEHWRSGYNLPAPLSYAGTVGQPLGPAAIIRTANAAGDIYFLFPARGTDKAITSARVYLLSRSGLTSFAPELSLEILGLDGTFHRQVSPVTLTIQTTPLNGWIEILPLSTNPGDRKLAAGEVLAFHFKLPAAPDGNLQVQAVFDVAVKQAWQVVFLPSIRR